MQAEIQPKLWIRQYWENPENQRYYCASVEQDIFGQWVLLCTWGGQTRASGRYKGVLLDDRDAGLRLLEQVAAQRQRRHYQPVVH